MGAERGGGGRGRNTAAPSRAVQHISTAPSRCRHTMMPCLALEPTKLVTERPLPSKRPNVLVSSGSLCDHHENVREHADVVFAHPLSLLVAKRECQGSGFFPPVHARPTEREYLLLDERIRGGRVLNLKQRVTLDASIVPRGTCSYVSGWLAQRSGTQQRRPRAAMPTPLCALVQRCSCRLVNRVAAG